MGTVRREDGFDFVIYPNDHTPAHVHVFKAEGEAKINIGDADTAASVQDVWGMKSKDVRKALEIVEDNWKRFLDDWRGIHGKE